MMMMTLRYRAILSFTFLYLGICYVALPVAAEPKDGGKKTKKSKIAKKQGKKADANTEENPFARIREEKLKALYTCRVPIAGEIYDHHKENWTQYVTGDIASWTENIRSYIEQVEFGMVGYQKPSFCHKLIDWMSAMEGNVGLCVLLIHHRLGRPGLNTSALEATCETFGFVSQDSSSGGTQQGQRRELSEKKKRRSLQTDSGTSSTCLNNVSYADLTSPSYCFIPDPYMYYTILFTQGVSGYLSHNFESTDGDKYKCSGTKYEVGVGQASGQNYVNDPDASQTALCNAYYSCGGWDIQPSGNYLLINDLMIQTINATSLSQGHWRFTRADEYDSNDEYYFIRNRGTGQIIDGDSGQLTADIYDSSNPTGCSLCTDSTGDNEWVLDCLGIVPGVDTVNFNFSDDTCSTPVDSSDTAEICVQEVVNYTRADATSIDPVTYDYSETINYWESGLNAFTNVVKSGVFVGQASNFYRGKKFGGTDEAIAKDAASFSATASLIFMGITALQAVVSVIEDFINPSNAQSSAIQQLADEILATAEEMSVDITSSNNVVNAAQQLNTARNEFQCDYVGNLVAAYENLEAEPETCTVDSDPSDFLCNNLINVLSLYNQQGTDAFDLLIPSSYCNSSSNEADCPDSTEQETARYGWDIIQVAVLDGTFILQEMMGIYAFIAGAFGESCGVCGSELSVLEEGSSDNTTVNICQNLYDGGFTVVNFENYRVSVETPVTLIPPMLNYLRFQQGFGNGSSTNDSPVWEDDSGGINKQYYELYDNYFSPNKSLANVDWKDGLEGTSYPDVPWQDIMEFYQGEISWDMINWSYNNSLAVNVTSSEGYQAIFIDYCEGIVEDPWGWWYNRSAILNTSCTACSNLPSGTCSC